MRRLAAALVLAALAAAVPVGPGAQAQRMRGGQIQLGETSAAACRARQVHFALDRLRDLHVCVVYQNLAGVFVQRLKFFGPDRKVYQVLAVPFATSGATVPPDGVDVDGVLREPLVAVPSRKGEVTVEAVLPVAASQITQYRLDGHWSVELSLNGRLLDREEFVIQAGR
jgi:hypothetical protein